MAAIVEKFNHAVSHEAVTAIALKLRKFFALSRSLLVIGTPTILLAPLTEVPGRSENAWIYGGPIWGAVPCPAARSNRNIVLVTTPRTPE